MADDVARIDPTPLSLECLGLTAGGHHVPPFQLHTGEAVCLHVEPASPSWYDVLLPLLTGRVSHPRLLIRGTVSYLERPMPRRGWFGRRKDCTARDWLISERGLAPAEAVPVLDRASVPPEMKIGWLGWNERTLFALESYLVRPPDILVFDTAGNDPLGIRRLFDRLATRPRRLAVIYLKTNLGTASPCYPGKGCLDIAARPLEIASVE
ncbi:MAG TPA: hypothetical protein VKA46_32755 [Gemmataceae bacterium]|nr:hypothetical protein [Gemmataceae bacterium]